MTHSANDRYAAVAWRKSSRSNGHGGNCVEAAACPHHVALRDSKLAHQPDYPVLTMSTTDWAALLTTIATR